MAVPIRPPAVTKVVGDHPWTPYPAGAWPGQVWQVGPYLVRSAGDPAAALDERARLDWLRPLQPAPEVLVVDSGWIVTATPAGHPCHRPDLAADLDAIPDAIGVGLRRIHELPVAGCPFEQSWETTVAQIQGAIATGRIDSAALPEPYRRHRPERLLEVVLDGRPPPPPALAVCHGSPAVSNLFVGGGHLTGVIGVHRLGVADRHLDLAAVHRSLNEVLGPQALFRFYEAYGDDPDLVRLDHYLLIDLLVSALRPAGAVG
jgi:aminoglycoside phosphotransferase